MENENEVVTDDGVAEEPQQQHESQVQPSVQYTDNMEQAKVDLAALKDVVTQKDPANPEKYKTLTPMQKRQFRELNEFIHFDGKLPGHLVEMPQADGHLPYDSESKDLIGTYAPAQDISQIKQHFDNVPETYDANDINDLRQLAVELELPVATSNTLIQKILDHTSQYVENGYDDLPQFEDAEDLDGVMSSTVNKLGGPEKFQVMTTKMMSYLERTLPADQFNNVVNAYDNTSVALDANIILKLSSLYDARFGSA